MKKQPPLKQVRSSSQTQVTARSSKSHKKKKITKKKGTNILNSSLERKGRDRMTSSTAAKTNKSITRMVSITRNASVTAKKISIANDDLNKANSEQNNNISRGFVFADLPPFSMNYNSSSSSIGGADVKKDLLPFPADISMNNNSIDNIINTFSHTLEYDKKEQPLSETNNDSSSMDTNYVDIKVDFPELPMDSIAATTSDVAMDSFIRSLMVGEDDDNIIIPSSYGS
jgi:hypothetical protein